MKVNFTVLAIAALVASALGQAERKPRLPVPADSVRYVSGRSVASAKLDGDLQQLVQAFDPARLGSGARLPAHLQSAFGIAAGDRSPEVTVVVSGKDLSLEELPVGGRLIEKHAGMLVLRMPVRNLERLCVFPQVETIRALKHRKFVIDKPVPPRYPKRSPGTRSFEGLGTLGSLSDTWNRQGLTGKGVIVAVIDSGIDWRHPDFLRADGTSRILFLYDLDDDSYSSSNRGTKPPLMDAEGAPIGTLYTNAQINAALKGKSQIASTDEVGHGTACAGLAAASGGVAGAPGLAPGADIIAVKFLGASAEGDQVRVTKWVIDTAKALNKPVVINMSYGDHYSGHDGQETDETLLDSLTGPGHPGVVICAAAGNEGRYPIHASGSFGPKRPGQVDIEGDAAEATSWSPTGSIRIFLDQRDEWGIGVLPYQDSDFLDEEGNPVPLQFSVYTDKKDFFVGATLLESEEKVPDSVMAQVLSRVSISTYSDKYHCVDIELPLGTYDFWGFGAGPDVKSGQWFAYAPGETDVSFGKGAVLANMVCSPANARNVLAIGSYVYRNQWPSLGGIDSTVNLQLGQLSPFSSPGPRRDGVVKPDIVAPGHYMISSLAEGAEMGGDGMGDLDARHVQPGEKRLAWMGTSAATPYAAGVIALMLEKNPQLTSDQVREIFRRTATRDSHTGPLPNPQWGNGKLNPELAIRETPAPASVPGLFASQEQSGSAGALKALLIGVDYADAKLQLATDGDVSAMLDLLKTLGYSGTPKVLRTREETTKANVLKEMAAFAKTVEDGDTALIYYSGHGGMAPDEKGGDEVSDLMDETIVLSDVDKSGGGHIRDDHINEWLTDIRTRARHLTVIFDACHSGTATKDILTAREVPKDYLPKAPEGRASDRTPAGWVDSESAGLGPMVFLAAARHDLKAYDRREGDLGAFTHALVQAVRKFGTVSGDGRFEVSVKTVFDFIRAELTRGRYDQDPQVEGNENTTFLQGTGLKPADPHFSVTQSGGLFRINGGLVMGLTRGTKLNLFKQNTLKPNVEDKDAFLGQAEIDDPGPFSSQITLLGDARTKVGNDAAMAFVAWLNPGKDKLSMWVDPALVDQPDVKLALEALDKRIVRYSTGNIKTASKEKPDMALRPGSGNSLLIVRSENEPDIEVPFAGIAEQLKMTVTRERRKRYLLGFANDYDGSRIKVEVRLVRLPDEGPETASQYSAWSRDPGLFRYRSTDVKPDWVLPRGYVAKHRELLGIQVRNVGMDPCFVSSIGIGGDGTVFPIWPVNRNSPVSALQPLTTGYGDETGWVFQGRELADGSVRVLPLGIYEPYGLDHIKVFATRDPLDLSSYVQSGRSKGVNPSPLEDLMFELTNGEPTASKRYVPGGDGSDADWWTVQLPLLSAPRKPVSPEFRLSSSGAKR